MKHPGEVTTLRSLYGDSFFLVSVYSPLSLRKTKLQERIMRSRQEYRSDMFELVAEALIERDLKEAGTDYGQDVRGCFPAADFFLDATTREEWAPRLARCIRILFGHPFITPTPDEHGMFHAKAAALRSAELARQVGAVIMSEHGEIISAGCNEVPPGRWRGSLGWRVRTHRLS